MRGLVAGRGAGVKHVAAGPGRQRMRGHAGRLTLHKGTKGCTSSLLRAAMQAPALRQGQVRACRIRRESLTSGWSCRSVPGGNKRTSGSRLSTVTALPCDNSGSSWPDVPAPVTMGHGCLGFQLLTRWARSACCCGGHRSQLRASATDSFSSLTLAVLGRFCSAAR